VSNFSSAHLFSCPRARAGWGEGASIHPSHPVLRIRRNRICASRPNG
jgi:hypothetical protein